MKFLSANWTNIIAINHKVEKELLLPYLPFDTFMDDYKGDYFVSLIGFKFENTKVLGIKFPCHINFEEVNLRFYVKDKTGEKGVVFIKEIVPKKIIRLIANSIYKEHYAVSKMNSEIQEYSNGKTIKYYWKQAGEEQFLSVETGVKKQKLKKGTKAEFIAEHYIGFTKLSDSKTSSYRVEHPKWEQLEVKKYELEVDFEANYGNQFSFLTYQKPDSVFFLKGSSITVNKNKINN